MNYSSHWQRIEGGVARHSRRQRDLQGTHITGGHIRVACVFRHEAEEAASVDIALKKVYLRMQ
jgi:hypothetical protein